MDRAPTQSASSNALDEADTLVLPGPYDQLSSVTELDLSSLASEDQSAGAGPGQEGAPPPHPTQEPVTAEQVPKGLDMTLAIQNFAKHHNVDPSKVSAEQVLQSAEGPFHWATFGKDTSARGPGAQSLKRAMQWRPDMREAYTVLLDNLKVEFRKAWMATKSFDFTTVRRSTTLSFRKRRDEVGSFKTKLQIQGILGGDHPDAAKQTEHYVSMCERDDLKEFCFGEQLFCTYSVCYGRFMR